ncbi:hypothetical protein BJ741DRAFT_689885 [Chytriomyces cf. hyalinus JEL632]|nr:hypothetical protein BJ741DRAFT_689885 [Chytriomyces cf. hyalinus JEL632]
MKATTLQELQSVGIAISFNPDLLLCTHCKQSIYSTHSDAVEAFAKAHISNGCFLPSSVPSITLCDEPRQVDDSTEQARTKLQNYRARRREEERNVWNGFQALYQHDRKTVIEVASVLGGFNDDLYQRMLVRVSKPPAKVEMTCSNGDVKLQTPTAPSLPALPTQPSPQLLQTVVTQDTFEYKKKRHVRICSTAVATPASKVRMDKLPKDDEEESVKSHPSYIDLDLEMEMEMDDTPAPAKRRRRARRKIQAKIHPVK